MHDQAITLLASGITVGGGLIAAAQWEHVPPMAGVLLACAGLVTAISSIVVPLAKIWSDQHTADRASKERRHHLADQLNTAMIEIDLLKAAVEQNQKAIADDQRVIAELRARLAQSNHVGEAEG